MENAHDPVMARMTNYHIGTS